MCPVAHNCRCQIVLPSVALNANTCSRSSLAPLDAVTITRSPTTIGLAGPRPGRSTFQATFFPSENSVGNPVSVEVLLLSVPRN